MGNKTDAIKEIFDTIENFYQEYTLPSLNIGFQDWDAFFDTLYFHFKKRKIEEDYKLALNIILRRAFNLSLMDNSKDFTIKYLILALRDLCAFKFKNNEIQAIKEEISTKIDLNKSKNYIKK